MYVSTLDARPILVRHGINTHHDELTSYLKMGAELTPAARAIARSQKFRRCAKEWCRAASAAFMRDCKVRGVRAVRAEMRGAR